MHIMVGRRTSVRGNSLLKRWREEAGTADRVHAAAIGSVAAASVLFHALPGPSAGWRSGALSLLCDAAFALAALACLRRSGTGSTEQRAWLLLGTGLAMYLGGELFSQLSPGPEPVPSVADALWLGFYVLTFASIALHARARARTRPPRTWLDGMIAGLTIGAATVAFALGPLLEVGSGSAPVILTGLAYPVADVMVLILLACAIQVASHASWSDRLQVAGLAAFLFADVSFLVGIAHGTWVDGSPRDLVWIFGVSLLGLSALAWSATERVMPKPPQLAVPMICTAAALALLVHGQWADLPPLAIVLAAAAVALALLRVALSVEEIRRLTRADREARFDPLTGLPNRRAFAERLDGLLDATSPMGPSVLLVDIDGFADVNRSLGYDAANRVLCGVAERLSALLRPGWTVARVGGDEFAVLLPAGQSCDAERIATEIRTEMFQTTDVAGIPVAMSTTIGIASAPEHGTTAAEVLTNADLAMNQAKRVRSHVASLRLDGAPVRRPALLAEIRAALDEGQITAHLQPQIDLATGRVAAVEALARWNHPDRGTVAPGAFIPLVVESGLLSELTAQMIDQAVDALVACSRHGHPIGVSANISALDLADEALMDRIESALTRSAEAGGELTLELTEDAVMEDRDRAIDVLARIRRLGARVSVDDYGTGQASLSYLRDLPLDELKLDRSFVSGAATDQRSLTIVRSTIELAHDLGLTTVGEGIEDRDTATWLESLGCDVGQGYWFARPMPLAELLPWLDRHASATPTRVGAARGER